MTAELYYERKTCRVCLSPDLRLALKLEATPLGDRYVPPGRVAEVSDVIPLDLMMCPACGNLQTLAIPNPDLIYKHFICRPAAINPRLFAAFEDYAEGLLRRFPKLRTGLAVEFGSNDGIFTRMLADRGMKVLGVDPAENLLSEAEALGVEQIADYFTTDVARRIREDRGPADLIVANYVFANIDDIDGVTTGVKELLAPDGIFTVETSYTKEVVDHNLLEVVNHDHLSYFYAQTMERFFARHGLDIFDVEYASAKGGALRCYVQHAGGPYASTDALRQALEAEEQMHLRDVNLYARLQRFVDDNRRQVQGLLRHENGHKPSVCAYGTSLAGTILTYQYGVASMIDVFFDDDQARHGLVSPGYGTLIVPGEELEARQPDVVLITAPQYAKQIMGKHQAYLDAGGKFVLVWPEFQVVSKAA
jgi:SAM-dependent methyltransferase